MYMQGGINKVFKILTSSAWGKKKLTGIQQANQTALSTSFTATRFYDAKVHLVFSHHSITFECYFPASYSIAGGCATVTFSHLVRWNQLYIRIRTALAGTYWHCVIGWLTARIIDSDWSPLSCADWIGVTCCSRWWSISSVESKALWICKQ